MAAYRTGNRRSAEAEQAPCNEESQRWTSGAANLPTTYVSLNELIRTYADESVQRDWGNFLADSLARYAGEGTLERVLADIRQELSKGRQ